MRITFIQPSLGRRRGKKFGRAWVFEPLTFSVLKALTPEDVEISLYDDRIEDIDYNQEADLVGITVETFTAKRSYEIARRFRDKNCRRLYGRRNRNDHELSGNAQSECNPRKKNRIN